MDIWCTHSKLNYYDEMELYDGSVNGSASRQGEMGILSCEYTIRTYRVVIVVASGVTRKSNDYSQLL